MMPCTDLPRMQRKLSVRRTNALPYVRIAGPASEKLIRESYSQGTLHQRHTRPPPTVE